MSPLPASRWAPNSLSKLPRQTNKPPGHPHGADGLGGDCPGATNQRRRATTMTPMIVLTTKMNGGTQDVQGFYRLAQLGDVLDETRAFFNAPAHRQGHCEDRALQPARG